MNLDVNGSSACHLYIHGTKNISFPFSIPWSLTALLFLSFVVNTRKGPAMYSLNVFTQNSYVEISFPKDDDFRIWSFGRCLTHEAREPHESD